MFLTILLLLSAMGLSTIAGYYSVAGMTAIFAASWWPIVIMTGTLEFSKIVVSSWLYRNWHKTPTILKIYFTSAVLILMFITSLGIFGYLSKAHIDQLAGVSDNPLFIKQIDQQIATEQARVDDSRKVITQMDSAVSSMISQSASESAQKANKGVSMAKQANLVRDSQKKDRIALNKAIDEANLKIKELNKEKLKLEQEQIKIEAEVGPIKYIAQMIYGDNPDKNLLEKSVRYIIILIIAVFDPLAVLMFIAANMSLVQLKEEKEQLKKQKTKEEIETVPPPIPTTSFEAVHIDKIDLTVSPISVDKESVGSVVESIDNIVDSLSTVHFIADNDPVKETTANVQINDETVTDKILDAVEPETAELAIEKKDEITDIDSISIEDLIILQEPVTEILIENISVTEEVIEEPIEDSIFEVETPIETQSINISDEELESIIDKELEILELIEEVDYVDQQEIIEEQIQELPELVEEQIDQIIEDSSNYIEVTEEAQQAESELEIAAESDTVIEAVDDDAKEVIIEIDTAVVNESVTETTYIDGKPITQFLEVQQETEVQPTVQLEPTPNQMLQFTATPAIVKKPDDILSTIKKYHNVRLDDARRTLR